MPPLPSFTIIRKVREQCWPQGARRKMQPVIFGSPRHVGDSPESEAIRTLLVRPLDWYRQR